MLALPEWVSLPEIRLRILPERHSLLPSQLTLQPLVGDRISTLALSDLLAPCVSMKIFHVYESAFSREKILHQNIAYQLQFCFTSKKNTMARPACWEIFKSDVLS